MKHPRHIWTLFCLTICAAVGGLAWLTVKALELDRAELTARQQARQEADVGLALWQMDGLITPILAQEAVRPHWAYESSYPGATKNSPRVLSPLIRAPEGVRLHFMLSADGKLTSPQCPQGTDRALAVAGSLTEDELEKSQQLAKQLHDSVVFGTLMAELPTETLPPARSGEEEVDAAMKGENNSLIPQNAAVQQQFAYTNNPDQQGQQAEGSRNDLGNRTKQLQNTAQIARGQNIRPDPTSRQHLVPRALEGVSRPLWIGSKLIIARQTRVADDVVIEGCWLDWDLIEQRLKEDVASLLPNVTLRPVRDVSQATPSRLLATLPVELYVPFPIMQSEPWSPLRIALLTAWAGLAVAGLAAAVMLRSVVALSERRAAFVSAVTHELRTPLTTFRLYAEMLSGGMVPEAEQQQEYLDTLRREADRLAQLVDNVLQYARLERNRHGSRRESIAIGALLERVTPRLTDRVTQAGLTLNVEFLAQAKTVDADAECVKGTIIQTDPAAVEQILFNLVDNACKYAAHSADRRLHLSVALKQRDLVLTVRDHGPGIAPQVRRRLFQPFSRPADEAAQSAPGVGLGLALCHRLAGELGGRLHHDSSCPQGACFRLQLHKVVNGV